MAVELAATPDTRTSAALDWLAAFLARRSATPAQAALLRLVVEEGREQAQAFPLGLPAAELPLLVYAAAGGPGGLPLTLAGCCLCVYLGADVFDNVADRELPPRWAARGPGQAALAGATLLSAFAAIALGELDAPTATYLALHEALADGLRAMAAGQTADLRFEGREDVTLADSEAMVLAKSGTELQFFAKAGAILAGAPPVVCEAYARFGRHFGAAGQIASDCGDLFGADAGADGEPSHDLAAGKRTLPIVYALTTLAGAARSGLLGHLAAAPHDPARSRSARQTLLDVGALQYGALVAEAHRRAALSALRAAGPAGSAADGLHRLLDDMTLFSDAVEQHA